MRREKCVHCKYDRHIYRQKDIDTLISKEQLMVFIKDFLAFRDRHTMKSMTEEDAKVISERALEL